MSDLSAYQEAMRLGHAYAWDLKWEAASRQYRQALSERPGDPSATLSLAVALERMGDLIAAREMYEEAQRLLPDHAPVLLSLVELQLRLEDHAAAATSYVQLAALYLDQNQPHRAEEMLRHLTELPQPDGRALRALYSAAERAQHSEILSYARDRLALLPEIAPPVSAVTDLPTEVTLSASDGSAVPVPASLLESVPPAVQELLETLDTRLAALANDSPPPILADWCPLPGELVTVPPVGRTALAVALFEAAGSLATRQVEAARDRCLEAIGLASDFLPIQVQLARIDVAAGDRRFAEWRLRAVADLYEIRGQLRQAAETWAELGTLILEPEAVDATVVDLLVRAGANAAAETTLRRAALRSLADGRVDDAIRLLGEAIEICPSAIELGLWRCRLLVEQGRELEAVRWIDQAWPSSPGHATSRWQLARLVIAARAGRWDSIERAFDDWQAVPPAASSDLLTEAAAWGALQGGSDVLWYLAGQILAHAGAVADAESCYRRALEKTTAPATILLALARLAAAQGDWVGAARWLTACLEAIESLPGDRRADAALHFLLEVADQLADDRLRARALAGLIELHPDDVARYAQLAESLVHLQESAGARQQLQRLAEVWDRLGEPMQALAAEQAAASLPPREPASLLRLARRFLAAGWEAEAMTAFEQASELAVAAGATELATVALRALIALTAAREPRRALAYRVQLVQLNPTDWTARQELATAYLRDGRLRHALAEVWSLARQLAEAGQWADAAGYYREALLLDPWDPTLLTEAAHALTQAGAIDEAAALGQRLRGRQMAPPEAINRGDLG